MALTSKTGLMESLRKPIEVKQKDPIELTCFTSPAPYVLRPFAGLYNPFSFGCSILCNHPADAEIKDVVKRAKDSLVSESKIELLAEEMAALRASLQQTESLLINETAVDFVQEELFRRYTQTDSRPLTPAPTLASAVSRGSLRRRCLTPDNPPAPRQKLVLDLRRSHSQETLCWHGFQTSEISSGLGLSSSFGASNTPGNVETTKKLAVGIGQQMPPLVSPATLSIRSPRGNIADLTSKISKNQLRVLQSKNLSHHIVKTPASKVEKDDQIEDALVGVIEGAEEDHELVDVASGEMRRRGRRRKRGNRVTSAVLVSNAENDPETQIAGIGSESHNPSSRASIAPTDEIDIKMPNTSAGRHSRVIAQDSFLEAGLLKHLQREVDNLAIESEFDPKRRCVLEEALRTRPERVYGKEMTELLKEIKLPPLSLTKWLHLPRVFSRRNAKFSLPIDRRDLVGLLPIQYVSEYANVSSSKQLLYQTVLEQFNPNSLIMPLESIQEALLVMMGETLTEEMAESFKLLLHWESLTTEKINIMNSKSVLYMGDSDPQENPERKESLHKCDSNLFAEFDIVLDKKEVKQIESIGIPFRLWCGICALCERLYAPLPPISKDPPHEVEVADFDTLQGKLRTQKIDDNLSYILFAIQNSHIDEDDKDYDKY